MAAVGEEVEEDDPMGEDVPDTRYDAAIRERELAAQKARIVSEMAANERRTAAEERQQRSSPRKQPLAPATTLPPSRSAVPIPEKHPSSRSKPTPVQPIPSPKEETSLFDTIAMVLVDAIAQSETSRGYRSPSEYSGL